MRTEWNDEFKVNVQVCETPMEAVETLETFFNADMWYAKGAEWKTEEDMIKYLNNHFRLCKESLIRIEKERGGMNDTSSSNKAEKEEKETTKSKDE